MNAILRRWLCISSTALFVSGALLAACADNDTNPIPVVPPFDPDGGPHPGDGGRDGASDGGPDGASDAGPDGASDAGPDDASDAGLDGGTPEAGDSSASTFDGASDAGEDGSLTTDGAATDV